MVQHSEGRSVSPTSVHTPPRHVPLQRRRSNEILSSNLPCRGLLTEHSLVPWSRSGLLVRPIIAMARLQTRKRRWIDGPSHQQPPMKKISSTWNHHSPYNFSPKFWDTLSKVWLTPRALRELDRRNNLQPLAPEPSAPASAFSMDLGRFARRGGPDLRHLRGVRLDGFAEMHTG